MPRSDFVIKCIKQSQHAKFEEVLNMYRELQAPPAVPSSSWSTCSGGRLPLKRQEVELELTAEVKTKGEKVKVDCTEFKGKQSIEEHDKEETVVSDDLVGYFTPVDPRYPVLDSILRYRSADKTEVLAIRISTALQHKHGPLEPLPKLLPPPPTKPQLALWDFRKGGKSCEWNPKVSEKWELLHVGWLQDL